ncbi:peptidyl-prolyl cis-trans isomerase G [Bacillus rossius redtenbacheri]|uniref:peptidyl-prolyl cis-trans isomerase G n=1 Tax=Bacillus rossius redtenbacheri TaxID=93214 RepID=UPI002FDE033D
MSVVIETTLGNMTVDLFVEERPNTCLNFLKLCKIKYYNFCLFHSVQHNFIAQTGDPSGTGKSGESVYSKLYGEKAKYYEAEASPKLKHSRTGLVSMVNCGNNMLGSQFFFTLSADLQSLDGQHCVFGEVVEGHDTLLRLNETICDLDHRPYQDVRIKHTVILVDPYEDPPGLPVPDASPLPSAETLTNGRIGPDEQTDEARGLAPAELEEMARAREAKAQATILEIVGDIPDAEVAPPENVLFVCKLNPVTSDDDLEIIFSRFGRVKSCEVIRDKKTGDSLQYAFVEFEERKACEDAYFKMDNVLIDDRRIHVDFSQSVSKYRWKGKGRGVEHMEGKDETRNHKLGDGRRRSPEPHGDGRRRSPEPRGRKEDGAPQDNGSGSPPRESPERGRRESSRTAERDRHRGSERRRGGEKRRDASRERERQRRGDDADRDRHRRERERSRSDRVRDSDRDRDRRPRDSDRERSRSDRAKDAEHDRNKSSKLTEDSDRSRSDKKAECKSKEIKLEPEDNCAVEKVCDEKKGAGNNVERGSEKDKLTKDVPTVKVGRGEANKTEDNLSRSINTEERVVSVKPREEAASKQLDKPKKSDKDIKDVDAIKQDLEISDKEHSRKNKAKPEEKFKEKPNQSDNDETSKMVCSENVKKMKVEEVDDSRWKDMPEDEGCARNSLHLRGRRTEGGRSREAGSESDERSDDEVAASEADGSECREHDRRQSKKPAGGAADRGRQCRRKGGKGWGSGSDSSGEVDVAGSRKRGREGRGRAKRRSEQSLNAVRKKRWRKKSSSSSDDSDSDSSSDSSDSSSDDSARTRARLKRSLKKHGLPVKKMKKLKMAKKKKKRLRHRRRSKSDSSTESSDDSDYKRKYIKLKKKKRKNISSDNSSSESEVRKRRERRRKNKQKKKSPSSENSDDDSASITSDTSYYKLMKKHKKKIVADKRAKKSKRDLKLSKKKNHMSKKRLHSEAEEQSSSDETISKPVKKELKKNGVEGKKVRKVVGSDGSS